MSEPVPSERELDILKALWKLGEGTVRQVLDVVAPQGELAFNTIQTQLRIMEEKGLVDHRADGRTFIYRPLYARDAASARFLDKVFDGAIHDLVLTLLQSQRITAEELEELEQLIAKVRRQSRSRAQSQRRSSRTDKEQP